MTGVFREVSIEWGGAVYRFTPSNRVIRRIEGEGISLTEMLRDLGQGRIMIGKLSYVLAAVLQSAGAAVTEDDMLMELQQGDQAAVFALAETVFAAIFPQPDPKKPAAPVAARPAATPKARGRKARGRKA